MCADRDDFAAHQAEHRGLIEQVDEVRYRIKKGFVKNMNTEGMFYVNEDFKDLVFGELTKSSSQQVEREEEFFPLSPLLLTLQARKIGPRRVHPCGQADRQCGRSARHRGGLHGDARHARRVRL